MHESIVFISKEPIDEDNTFDSFEFCDRFDWFVSEIADYVDDLNDEDMKERIEYTFDQPGLRYHDGKLTVMSKEAYFLDRYKKFIDVVRDACQWSLDDFVSGNKWLDIFNLRDLYEDKFGTYVLEEYNLTTLDDFIRDCDNNAEFYVCKALDYHF